MKRLKRIRFPLGGGPAGDAGSIHLIKTKPQENKVKYIIEACQMKPIHKKVY